MNKTIFLGGSPGAGKSFLADEIVRINPKVRHEVAGHLIRTAMSTPTEDYQRPVVANSAVADRFQLHLIAQLEKIRSEYDGVILLDGHYVVPTKTGFHPVSADVFVALKIDTFVIVESSPQVVFERLQGRSMQGWWDGRIESIVALCRMEADHANLIAQSAGRPLIRVSGESLVDVNAVSALLA